MSITVSISPVLNGVQFLDNNGMPLSGGKIFQYEADSTSVQQATYTDNTAFVANANPITLDSSGRLPTEIYLVDGQSYNLVLTMPDGTTVLTYVDNVVGVLPAKPQAGPVIPVWNIFEGAITYVGPTQIRLAGDQVTNFAPSNRVKMFNGSVYQYGTVTASTFTDPYTQVTIRTDDVLPISPSINGISWSILVSNGMTVDAGAVAFNAATVYTTTGTVGSALRTLTTAVTTVNGRVTDTYKVTFAAGTGTYTATADSNLNSYTLGQVFTVQFGGASVASATLNVNGLGAIQLYQYSSTGAKVNPVITGGMVSQVAYDGANFILLNPIAVPAATGGGGGTPVEPPTAPGLQLIVANGSFTIPIGVTRVKVTAIGGGGGSGLAYPGGYDAYSYPGGYGGPGGVANSNLAVVGGTVYTVTIGVGGLPATDGSHAGAGFAGGSTSFGGIVTASGGLGGQMGTASANGENGASGVVTTGLYGVGRGTYQYGSTDVGTGGHPIPALTSPALGSGTSGMVMVEW